MASPVTARLRSMDWPEGFLWGRGASSTRCEGAAPASDWCDWERAGHAPISGDGNGFADRYAEDFGLYAEYGNSTADDAIRAADLERGLEVFRSAITRGIDVCGFFPWTGVDNYEWLHGDDVDFGIVDRDRNVRPSASVLQREARGTGE